MPSEKRTNDQDFGRKSSANPMEIANGTEPDGIKYRVFLAAPNWVAQVTHPDGRFAMESWLWAAEPRAGVDMRDIAELEDVLERLISGLRT